MTTDYYAQLGVSRDASADDIKMAYRHLARELHPDMNPDPAAQERFKAITHAHEVLADPGKRQMYDLSSYPFAAGGGSFGQSRPKQRSEENWYPRHGRASRQERRPPPRSDDARNQYRDQGAYADYARGQSPAYSYEGQSSYDGQPSYDWRRLNDWTMRPAKSYQPRRIPVAAVLICAMLAVVVFLAVRLVTNRGLRVTNVTTTTTITSPHGTWAPPSGIRPAKTASQAWQSGQASLTWPHGSAHLTVQLGEFTQAQTGYTALAYGYSWTACLPGADIPVSECGNWLFVNANTGVAIGWSNYSGAHSP